MERILDRERVEERQLFGNKYQHISKIRELQANLKEIGYNPGPVDGKIGYRTRGAVKAFQKDI